MTKARDIADGVDTADIADGAISTAKLADGSISTAKIADSAISAAKIADGDITDAKLASGISASKLTGALPAVDGSALTGLGGGALKIAAVTEFNNSGTWTPTANTNYVEIAAIGAGGGGGAYYYFHHAGGGGGGVVRLGANRDTFGSTETVTIGSGGNKGQYTGSAGGTTTFGNSTNNQVYFTLNGGNGGSANTSNNGNATGGTGGTASTNLTAGSNVSYISTGTGGSSPDVGYNITGNNTAPAPNQGNLANEGVYSTGGRTLIGTSRRKLNVESEALVPTARPATPDKKVNLFSADYVERRGGSGFGYVAYNSAPNTSVFVNNYEQYGDNDDGDDGFIKITEYEDL